MANRNFNAVQYSYEAQPVKIYAKIRIAAAGAVNPAIKFGLGIKNVVKEATAGQYTIEFQDSFARFLFLSHKIEFTTPSAVATVQLLETPGNYQAELKADRKMTIQLLDFAGAAVNAEVGADVLLEITMRQSKIGRGD